MSDHLDIGKALPGPSQGLDPYVWTLSHPYLVSGSSETLQTSCCLQSTNDFYWDLSLTGHQSKGRDRHRLPLSDRDWSKTVEGGIAHDREPF